MRLDHGSLSAWNGHCNRAVPAGSVVALLVLVMTVGCGSQPAPPPPPPMDAGQVASSATRTTSLDAPYRLVFEWAFNEPGTRLRGRGVARIEPPYRSRLDLFLPNGERAAAVALVGADLRIAADTQTELPVPAMLWGTLGVFHPGPSSALGGGQWHGNGLAELRYLPPGGGELLYRLRQGQIEQIDFMRDGRAREELRLSRVDGERFPREAVYRHLEQVRELRITMETVEHVESYPSDIWDPGV